MRSDYVERENLEHVLAALMPQNRLACEVSLATGLRIGDVLSLKTEQLKERFSVYEQKTGKRRSVRLNADLLERCLKNAGHMWVFPHRTNGNKHRSRQAVYKDLKRAAFLFRVSENLCPHSLRKVYAVEDYKKYGDLKRVQHLLNHDKEAVTLLYALADSLTKK